MSLSKCLITNGVSSECQTMEDTQMVLSIISLYKQHHGWTKSMLHSGKKEFTILKNSQNSLKI